MGQADQSLCLSHRLRILRQRRQTLAQQYDALRRALPDSEFVPRQLATMTAGEIRALMSELAAAEAEAELSIIERELEMLDGTIEQVENQLLATPAPTVEAIQRVLEIALAHCRARTPTDPADLFYDYGDARLLMFLERVSQDLQLLSAAQYQAAG
jgi:prefoldin subunit 5